MASGVVRRVLWPVAGCSRDFDHGAASCFRRDGRWHGWVILPSPAVQCRCSGVVAVSVSGGSGSSSSPVSSASRDARSDRSADPVFGRRVTGDRWTDRRFENPDPPGQRLAQRRIRSVVRLHFEVRRSSDCRAELFACSDLAIGDERRAPTGMIARQPSRTAAARTRKSGAAAAPTDRLAPSYLLTPASVGRWKCAAMVPHRQPSGAMTAKISSLSSIRRAAATWCRFLAVR